MWLTRTEADTQVPVRDFWSDEGPPFIVKNWLKSVAVRWPRSVRLRAGRSRRSPIVFRAVL